MVSSLSSAQIPALRVFDAVLQPTYKGNMALIPNILIYRTTKARGMAQGGCLL